MIRSSLVLCAALALAAGPALALDGSGPQDPPPASTSEPKQPTPATPAPAPAPAPAQAGQISDEDMQRLFEAWDANHDGAISLAEWLGAGRQETGFRQVDTDRNQAVTAAELRAAIIAMQSGG